MSQIICPECGERVEKTIETNAAGDTISRYVSTCGWSSKWRREANGPA